MKSLRCRRLGYFFLLAMNIYLALFNGPCGSDEKTASLKKQGLTFNMQ